MGREPRQGWARQRCYFKVLHQKTNVCVSEVYQRGQSKTKERCLLFSLEARGSGWFWGCVSEPSWCFSPSWWTARQEAGTPADPIPFCYEEIDLRLKWLFHCARDKHSQSKARNDVFTLLKLSVLEQNSESNFQEENCSLERAHIE